MKRLLFCLGFAGLVLGARWEAARPALPAPVWFEPNVGQVKGRTEFVGRACGAFLYMTGREVVYAMAPAVVVPGAKMRQVLMRFDGAAARAIGTGEESTGGHSNYFVGKTEREWFVGVPHFQRLRFREVYPGIDVVYYGAGGAMEFDLVARPGADLSQVGIRFGGAALLAVGEEVVVNADGAEMRMRRPRVFQAGVEVPSWYENDGGVVRVRTAGLDPRLDATIDPVLDFSTYLGGPGADSFGRMAMAPDGNLLLAGSTQSPASPALDPFRQPSVVSLAPILLKMSADGRRIVFYTILGRNGWDSASTLAIGKDGTIATGGTTRSVDFPTKNAFQTSFKAIWDNAWVARLSGDGRNLIYCSYLGGSNTESVAAVTLDGVGNAYFVGSTQSNDFPVVKPLQSRLRGLMDGFVTRISPEGQLLFSTYFGGSVSEGFSDVVWRADGVLLLTGGSASADYPLKDPIQTVSSPRSGWNSAFLTMLAEDGSAVRYSTYFGGLSSGGGNRIALGADNRIYIAGSVVDQGYPEKDPLFLGGEGSQGFLTIFDPAGRERIYSTLIPGAWVQALAVDTDGSIVMGGSARSTDFPLKDSWQPFRGGGVSGTDCFLMKLSANGASLVFSTLIGGSDGEFQGGVVLAPGGVIYASGAAISIDFPVKQAYQPASGGGNDGFFYRATDDTARATPGMVISPSRLNLRYVRGETLPGPVAVSVRELSSPVFASASVLWLRVTPASLRTSGTLTVEVDPVGLAAGLYQGSVRVASATGTASTIEVSLTVVAEAPVLSAATPGLVAVGTDETEITLRGSGFTNQTTVQIWTVPWLLSPVRFVDASTLRFRLPKPYFSAQTNHSITVQNPNSAASKPVSLAVGHPAPTIAQGGVVSGASYAGGAISPGEIVTFFGANFAPGMRVNFDGILATPFVLVPGQLNVVVPEGLAGAKEVSVVVERDFDWRSVPARIPVWPARPGLFSANGTGTGLAAALNEDGSVNSKANAAARGSIVVLWGTGGGVSNLPSKVYLDGMESEVLYAGSVGGVWQLNIRIPESAVNGEVAWKVGDRESQPGIFVALREPEP